MNAKRIDRSLLQEFLHRIKVGVGEDIAQAILAVADAIEHAGNLDAVENFETFRAELMTQLMRSQLRKSVLRAFWGGILVAMPVVKKLPETAVIVARLLT